MDRAVKTLPRAIAWGLQFSLVAVLVGLSGCVNPQVRSQSEDDPDHEKYDVQTVGDLTEVGNHKPIQVGGIGLVINLEGTGGSAPPGSERAVLEDHLLKNQKLLQALLRQIGCKAVKELLNSNEAALVRVSAVIPPGIAKGDTVDVEVTLPPLSKATSLRGGYLIDTTLYNYDFARNLSPNHANSDRAFMGHPMARAEGALLVGFGDGDEAAKEKVGRIWGGARCKETRPFYLVLKEKHRLARVGSQVADRINESFHGSFRGPGAQPIAVAKDNQYIVINVPPQYHHNLPRFIRVVRMVPMRETPEKADDKPRVPYRKRLADDLVD